MESQQQDKQIEQEEKEEMKVEFELPGGKRVKVELNGQDLLEEVRTFLMEQNPLILFTNFQFMHKGTVLHNYLPLHQLQLPPNPLLQVIITPFHLKSALHHYHKLSHFFNNPSLIAYYFNDIHTESNQSYQQLLKEKEQEKEKDKQQNQDKEKQKEKGNDKNEKKQQKQVKGEEEKKKSKTNRNEQEEKKHEQIENWLEGNLESYKRLSRGEEEVKQGLVYWMCQSGFNPVGGHRQLMGDLLYLQVLTLENTTLHITCSAQGFYLNRSEYNHFDPNPKETHIYQSLVDLLRQASEGFKRQWDKLVTDRKWLAQGSQQVIKQQLGCKYHQRAWVGTQAKQDHDVGRNEQQVRDTLATHNRDWNEELQLVKELPAKEFMERMNKVKVLHKIYSEFVECCRAGVVDILSGNVQSLNFYEEEAYRIYQHNNVFYTVMAENTLHLQASLKNQLGESHPTVMNSNQDLRNLNVLENYLLNNETDEEMRQLHLVNTVLVDYKGQRVLCQSIIPGILNDIQTSFKQGCMDEGLTIVKQDDYDSLVARIAKVFHLKSSLTFQDTQHQQHTLSGSVEVKGIQGQDNKKYILDLMRLSARDLNYPDPQLHSGCVLRHELVESYQMVQTIKQVEAKLKAEDDQGHDAANQALRQQILQSQDPQDKQHLQEQLNHKLSQQYIERVNRFQKMVQQKEYKVEVELDPSIATPFPAVDSTPQDQDMLTTLAAFLREDMVNQLVADLSQGDQIKMHDTWTFSEVFHQYGVNNRYLGLVLSKVDQVKQKHLHTLLQRVVLVRCLKHILRQFLAKLHYQHIALFIAHFFNLLFTPHYSPQQLSHTHKLYHQQQQHSSQQDNTKKKNKKKNRNNKHNKQNNNNKHQNNNYVEVSEKIDELELTREELWKQVVEISKNKYGHEMCGMDEFEGLKGRMNKLACLRDLCQRTGVQVKGRQYSLEEGEGEGGQKVFQGEGGQKVFQVEDILGLVGVVKCIEYQSKDVKAHLDTADRLYQEAKVKEALDCYQQLGHLMTNIYGHSHQDLGLVYHKLAALHLANQDFQNALLYQKESYHVYRALRGLDDRRTGQALMTLGLYCNKVGLQDKAQKNMMKALFFMSVGGGEVYSECIVCFVNLANIYMDKHQHQQALSCLFECLETHAPFFHQSHFLILYIYRHIVTAHKEIGDLKKALQYQEKVLHIMQDQLALKQQEHDQSINNQQQQSTNNQQQQEPNNKQQQEPNNKQQQEPNNKQQPSKQILQFQMFLQNEKAIYQHLKTQIQDKLNKNSPLSIQEDKEGKRHFGQNKVQKKPHQPQITETQNNLQKEELKERLKLAKLTKMTGRQGFRPNQQLHQNLYWINQQNKE